MTDYGMTPRESAFNTALCEWMMHDGATPDMVRAATEGVIDAFIAYRTGQSLEEVQDGLLLDGRLPG